MALYRPDLGTEIPRVSATREAVWASLRGKRRDVGGWLFEMALLLTLLLSLGVLVTLLVNILSTGWDVFATRKLDFLTRGLSSIASRAGVWQGLLGSLMLMVFVIVLAFPIGIGAAVYLEEYAPDNRVTRFMTTNIRNLAGVPSIVYGLLGLAIFVLAAGGITGGLSVISGGLTLAILVLPIVILTSMEALRAVPSSIREAGYAVGATQWEVIRSHVLPYASPGIFTGTVLSMARALGETAPLILVGAVTGFFFVSSGGLVDRLQGPYTALPTVVFAWSRLPGEDFRQMAAAASVILMVLILVVNATAILLRNRYERKW
ncbi:MAG TPA: phosphate ABC transporter permease PstA [Actinomycetota bacterium]|jgi:phosphate transport system permease protein|nr:phosphate ABC transporter permease PstA [Actinomycetota bacterium]